MSKCFGYLGKQNSSRVFAKETKRQPDELDKERIRKRSENWYVDFKDARQYVEHKLKMLRNEMYIEPTDAEVLHLYELKTETSIDNAVHSIIARHWSEF